MGIKSRKDVRMGTEPQKNRNVRIDLPYDKKVRTDWQSIIEEETEWQYDDLTEAERKEQERLEAERRQRRQRRIAEMKREKHRREMLFRYAVPGAAVCCVLLFILGIGMAVRSGKDRESGNQQLLPPAGSIAEAVGRPAVSMAEAVGRPAVSMAEAVGRPAVSMAEAVGPAGSMAEAVGRLAGSIAEAIGQTGNQGIPMEVIQQPEVASPIGSMLPETVFIAHTTENTNGFSDSIVSSYGIIIDVESGEILAEKGGWSRINPASMTKILTLLVAAEHMTDIDGTFTMTVDITDYSYINGCSNVGFLVGEQIPVSDLFYGTALKSGGDAALGLAVYVAGSHEAFVDMMNAKLEELGLSETTHFTNCIGLYDENHYSTPYDMAVILKEATDNELCRQVLSEHHYITTPTAEHPEGIDISNWFLRRIEDRDTHGEVLCAKTGFVVQSKNCAASLAADHNGREYICVTAGSDDGWTCIRDHTELYQRYLPE